MMHPGPSLRTGGRCSPCWWDWAAATEHLREGLREAPDCHGRVQPRRWWGGDNDACYATRSARIAAVSAPWGAPPSTGAQAGAVRGRPLQRQGHRRSDARRRRRRRVDLQHGQRSGRHEDSGAGRVGDQPSAATVGAILVTATRRSIVPPCREDR